MFLLLWLACSPSPEVLTEEPEVEALTLPVAYPRPTTKGSLALEGLDQRILSLNGVLGKAKKTQSLLVEARALRMSLTGSVSDLDAMLAVATEPDARARALLAAHQFDEALQADPTVAESVALARQEGLDALASSRREVVQKYPSSTSWMRLGDVLAGQGKTHEADEAYWNALDLYRDVSPLTVADVQFRRGLLFGESGEDSDRARALYQDAVGRLPGFVRAHVHLAELEWEAGEKTQAIARVRAVAKAQDPEPGGKLAIWLEGDDAVVWRDRTIAAYDRLLAKHPLAFADHAAEFFMAIGDEARAAELAKRNLDNRATTRARDLCDRAHCTP